MAYVLGWAIADLLPLTYLVAPAWVLLVLFPNWKWTRYCSMAPAIILSLLYAVVLIPTLWAKGFSFIIRLSTFAGVSELFATKELMICGWIHFAVFGLLLARWELYDSKVKGIPHLLVVPCMLLTLTCGPVGWMMYLILRGYAMRKRHWM